MKVAIIGSRNIIVNELDKYIPEHTTEIVSGGAKGVDTCASDYAKSHGIKLTEFLPEYSKYRKAAPLKRNLQIIEYCDLLIAFWDGHSKGTKYVIEHCEKSGKKAEIIVFNTQNDQS